MGGHVSRPSGAKTGRAWVVAWAVLDSTLPYIPMFTNHSIHNTRMSTSRHSPTICRRLSRIHLEGPHCKSRRSTMTTLPPYSRTTTHWRTQLACFDTKTSVKSSSHPGHPYRHLSPGTTASHYTWSGMASFCREPP